MISPSHLYCSGSSSWRTQLLMFCPSAAFAAIGCVANSQNQWPRLDDRVIHGFELLRNMIRRESTDIQMNNIYVATIYLIFRRLYTCSGGMLSRSWHNDTQWHLLLLALGAGLANAFSSSGPEVVSWQKRCSDRHNL